MKIHPTQKKRNLNNDVVPNPKKLKRLPHVFAKVLELPFNSNADVFVQETQDSFLFIASGSDGEIVLDDFQAHVVKILPGVTKVSVLKGSQDDSLVEEEEFDMNIWRFRLPSTTCPEMASATCTGGQLVVTVPKAVEDNYGNSEDEDEYDDAFWNSDVSGNESLFVV